MKPPPRFSPWTAPLAALLGKGSLPPNATSSQSEQGRHGCFGALARGWWRGGLPGWVGSSSHRGLSAAAAAAAAAA